MREPIAGILLGAALLLPSPGTPSRERTFCGAWLPLAAPAQHEILKRAEQAQRSQPWNRACRAGLREGLRQLLVAECRNWRQLMDYEVRALVDRMLEPCRDSPPS